MLFCVRFYVKVIAFLSVNLAKSEAEEISFISTTNHYGLSNLWIKRNGEKIKTVDLCSWFNEQPRLTARYKYSESNY